MPYRIKGTLKLPSGQPAAGVDIEFISRRNYSPLLMDLSSIIKTTSTGAYDITLEYGEYAVVVYWGCNQPSHIGKLFVFSDTATGLDLQTLLQQSDWQPATPEYIQQIQDWLTAANSLNNQAIQSASAAKASEIAVEADRAEVASNKTIVVDAQADVSAKAADVTVKAAQVAVNTAIVNEKTPLAIAAADTASQKAVDAAASDASARDAAARAENAALAMTGAILDGGECDLSSGFYPQPLTVNGNKYSTVWYVKVGGSVGGITYDAGDKLQYTTANSGFYFRIDARDDVVSVNGKKGAVTLNAQEVGADPAGTASSAVSQHAQKAGAHQISGIAGLRSELDSKYSQGNIVGSVSQSGGVPTGAIIQRGRNANGEFVRFADGTQICTFSLETSNTDLGTLGQNKAVLKQWTFPANFSSSVGVTPSIRVGSGDPLIAFSHSAQGGFGAGFAEILIRTDSNAPATNYGVNVSYLAIGRWF